jgi:hypothetical protein
VAVVGVISEGDLPGAIWRTRADVVVVGQDPQGERDSYLSLLLRHPRIKVLAITENGNSGALYELRPRRIFLGKISARTLVKAIRRRAPLSSETTMPRTRLAKVHDGKSKTDRLGT